MFTFKRILCPVDFSVHSAAGIELATSLAKAHQAVIVFVYVTPYWLPEETLIDSHYILDAIEADKKTFQNIRPADESVKFEHVIVNGNPGPEIVQASQNCDMIVMSTHGHTGIVRLLVGSVAEYVMRHAQCPVITFKPQQVKNMKSTSNQPAEKAELPDDRAADSALDNADRPIRNTDFVTRVMHYSAPIQNYQKMEEVIAELDRAKQTGAPVVDEAGKCIGVLTSTDIENFRELKQRYEARDETVIDEIFETDEFGQRRAGNSNFDLVCKHFTAPAVTVTSTDSSETAQQVFDQHSQIHHLVVVDQWNHPIGILEKKDLDLDANLLRSNSSQT